MASKYSGLPDIDSAPDVFETPDEPEVSGRRDEDNEEDSRKASLPDSSKEIDTGGLPSRRQAGSKFTRDSAPPVAIPKETPVARLRRLQAEVAQLEAEMSTATSTPAPGPASSDDASPAAPAMPAPPKRRSVVPSRHKVDVVTELSLLRDKLNVMSGGELGSTANGIDWKARLQRLEETQRSPTAAGEPAPASTSPPQAGDIDKRLASLEQQVGVVEDGDASNLVDTIQRMDQVLNVLTQPRHLDSIARRVKLLLVELERASAASRRTSSQPDRQSTADQEALQSLFALLPRLDPLIPIIPPLLNRLRSLSSLHAEALSVAADLRELQSADQNVSEEESQLRTIVEGVQQGISEALTGISANWEAVQKRVTALEERMAALAT